MKFVLAPSKQSKVFFKNALNTMVNSVCFLGVAKFEIVQILKTVFAAAAISTSSMLEKEARIPGVWPQLLRW